MKEGTNIQQKFFQELKVKLPCNLSLANVVADELCISTDSAYRRIRGESDLSLKEFDILSSKYKVSADSILSKSQSRINFTYRSITLDLTDISLYFKSLINEIISLKRHGLKEIIYTAMDLPTFYYFMCPKLAKFKIFVWKKQVSEFKTTNDARFESNHRKEEGLEKIYKMLPVYLSIPTIEIWTEETLNITLKQISNYYEAGMFKTKRDVIDILDELKKVVNLVQDQAELGHKFYPGNYYSEQDRRNNFKFYYQNIPLQESVTLLKLEKFNMVQLSHDAHNILTTDDEDFFQDRYIYIQKLIKKSTCLSVMNKKGREHFFHLLLHKIDGITSNL